MNLHQWASISNEVMDLIPEEDLLVMTEDQCNILGILWNVKTDSFLLKSNVANIHSFGNCTRRNILAVYASIFYP